VLLLSIIIFSIGLVYIMLERRDPVFFTIHHFVIFTMLLSGVLFLSFLFLVGCGGWFSILHIIFCFELYVVVISVYYSTA
jgi:hypothetical protein